MKLSALAAILMLSQSAFSETILCTSIEELAGGPNLSIEIERKTTNPLVPSFDVTVKNVIKNTEVAYSATGVVNSDKIYLRLFSTPRNPSHPVPAGLITATKYLLQDKVVRLRGTASVGKNLNNTTAAVVCTISK